MAQADDETPRPTPGLGTARDISRLSIEELESYIRVLETEIARARRAIDERRAVRDAAEALFKTKR